jgi:hypothetical protein
LHLELSEVEIRTGIVADSHGLSETTLGVVAVKSDAIDDDGDNFNDNFDNAANKRPVLLCVSKFPPKGYLDCAHT